MAKKLTSVLGVDVGSQKIKIAELKVSGKEPAITALAIADTPAGAVDHTGVYDIDTVSAVIKEMLTKSGATASHMVVSVAGQASVLVRTLEVPKMTESELKDHMNWEITRNIPFAESTVVSDFKAFPVMDPAATNMDVVMAISPQSAIDTLISMIKKSGKQAAALDVEPLGLARTLATSHGDDLAGKTVCLVDIGHKSTSINMYRDGHLLMPRMVPIGGENFTQSISEQLGVAFADAEAIKLEKALIPESAGAGTATFDGGYDAMAFQPYNPFADPSDAPAAAITESGMTPYQAADPMAAYNPFADPDAEPEAVAPAPASAPEYQTQAMDPVMAAPAPVADNETTRIFNSFAPVLDEFVSEVRRSIDYFRSKGGDVDVVMLCGGGAKLLGLSPFLTKSLGIDTTLYDPLRAVGVMAKRLEPGLLENHRQEFAVAVGNGLHIFYN